MRANWPACYCKRSTREKLLSRYKRDIALKSWERHFSVKALSDTTVIAHVRSDVGRGPISNKAGWFPSVSKSFLSVLGSIQLVFFLFYVFFLVVFFMFLLFYVLSVFVFYVLLSSSFHYSKILGLFYIHQFFYNF